MKNACRRFLFLCLVGHCSWPPPAVLAQVTTATFYGIVTDPSGGVAAGADVTLTHQETRATMKSVTGETGEFVFEFLPIGSYSITIELPGFKRYVASGIQLGAAQRLRQRFALEVGAVAETVTVLAETKLVNTVSPEQAGGLTEIEIKEIPISKRNLASALVLNSGISTLSGGNQAGSFNLNGLARGATSITMDGIDASANPEGPQLSSKGGFSYISVVSLEAVQEVQVSKGVFAAEYSRASGGNINVITKSGGNDWHGSLFEVLSAEELNARQPLLASKRAQTFNQFGGALSGPVWKDKVMFFAAYEGYRERTAQPVQGNVPTQRLRDDMLRRWPDYKLALDNLPLPNQPLANPSAPTGAFIGAGSVQSDDDHFVIKPDLYLSNRARISATYMSDNPSQTIPSIKSTNPRIFDGNVDRLTVTSTLFGRRWSSETRYGWNRADRERLDGAFNIKDPSRQETTLGGRRIPAITALGFSTTAGEIIFEGNAPHWSIEQKVAITSGKHSLKFGGIFYRDQMGRTNSEVPGFTYNTEQELLNNTPVRAVFTFGQEPYRARSYQFGFFIHVSDHEET